MLTHFLSWLNQLGCLQEHGFLSFVDLWKTNVKSIFTDPEVIAYVSDLHDKYVVIPADKASNNFVFLRCTDTFISWTDLVWVLLMVIHTYLHTNYVGETTDFRQPHGYEILQRDSRRERLKCLLDFVFLYFFIITSLLSSSGPRADRENRNNRDGNEMHTPSTATLFG